MFASVRRYRMRSGSMDEIAHLIDEEFAEQVCEIPGFVAYQLLGLSEDEALSISVFRDQEGAEESDEIAMSWARHRLAPFSVERTDIVAGDVLVSRAAADMLQPAHH